MYGEKSEETEELKLDLEDDVRLELFVDNLKLHKIYLETLNNNNNAKSKMHSKYLKKMLKILTRWEEKFESTNVEMSDCLK